MKKAFKAKEKKFETTSLSFLRTIPPTVSEETKEYALVMSNAQFAELARIMGRAIPAIESGSSFLRVEVSPEERQIMFRQVKSQFRKEVDVSPPQLTIAIDVPLIVGDLLVR